MSYNSHDGFYCLYVFQVTTLSYFNPLMNCWFELGLVAVGLWVLTTFSGLDNPRHCVLNIILAFLSHTVSIKEVILHQFTHFTNKPVYFIFNRSQPYSWISVFRTLNSIKHQKSEKTLFRARFLTIFASKPTGNLILTFLAL